MKKKKTKKKQHLFINQIILFLCVRLEQHSLTLPTYFLIRFFIIIIKFY